jgi:hypothetical protein
MELRRDIDPKLAKFLARHAVSVKQEVEDDVAPNRGKTPEECWADVVALSRTSAWAISLQPDPLKIAATRDPPHPSYAETVRRLRASWRNTR